MPRDYKHPARKRRASRARAPKRWPWLFGGLALGFLGGYAVYFTTTRAPARPAQELAQKPAASASKPAVPVKPADGKDAQEKARFDFYKMLPEMEVKVPNDAPAAARADARKPDQDGPYILQVGSFSSYGEADNLKARLAFIGVEASIQTVIINNETTWYRVRVGPYKHLRDLQQARATLQRNNIDFMLLALKPEAG
jgi:cell division protein FtsN